MFNVGPYTYKRANFQMASLSGYWVRLYCLFDGVRVHVFFNESDWLDNGCLIHEIEHGIVTNFYRDILVTPSQHKEIYYKILDFENVLKSNLNQEC